MLQPSSIKDLSKLCLPTQTNKPWSLEQCVKSYSELGIPGISVWRHVLENVPLATARKMINDHGLEVVSLVRAGFFASVNGESRRFGIEDNLRAIEEAEGIGSPLLVLVCGADPGQSQETSRGQIMDGIIEILPAAEAAGVRLAIEPLHPMYAADRSAITSMAQANDMVASINSDSLGVAVDVFHLWWDPGLHHEIKRCGELKKLFAYHVCDWNVPLNDMLNDRGLMGDGCIDLKQIRGWMEEAGFSGYHEVEIFSDKYWAMDQPQYVEKIINAYLNYT